MRSLRRALAGLTSRRIPLSVAVIASLAMMVLAGGVAFAAAKRIISPDPTTHLIHACYNSSSGTIKIVNTGERCHQGETAITWNQTGPAGSQGPAGPQGPVGPQGPAGSARDVGTVVSVGQGGPSFYFEGLKGWVAVRHLSLGQYCLTPDAGSNLGNTALVLSIGSPGSGIPGFVVWEGYCSLTPFELQVAVFDQNVHLVDNSPFTAVIP